MHPYRWKLNFLSFIRPTHPVSGYAVANQLQSSKGTDSLPIKTYCWCVSEFLEIIEIYANIYKALHV